MLTLWEKCKPGIWVEIYDNTYVEIVERNQIPGSAISDIFEIKYSADELFLKNLTSQNINKVLSPEEYPELYL